MKTFDQPKEGMELNMFPTLVLTTKIKSSGEKETSIDWEDFDTPKILKENK